MSLTTGITNNSKHKLNVEVFKKPDGFDWVIVTLLKYGSAEARFIPSFCDLWRIIQAIGYCEDRKYPPPANGRYQLAAFLTDAVHIRDFAVLASKYQIPERDGDQVTNPNGSRVKPSTTELRPGDLFTAADIPWGSK
jgi:hypothetical protein